MLNDGAAGLLFPFPDFGQKRLTPHVGATGLLGFGQFALHNHLRRNTCVVRSGLPQGIEPPHPVPADQDILECVVKRVPHVQHTGHIWRGDHDGKGFGFRRIRARTKRARGFPFGINAAFGLIRVKVFFQCHDRPALLIQCLLGNTANFDKGKP